MSREYTGEELGAGVSIILVDTPPGRGPSLHRHRYEEVFVVREGEVTFTLGDEGRVARAGDIVVVPPARRTRSATPARYRSGWSRST